MTYRQIDKLLRKDGWFLISQKGSHRQYKHAVKPGKVTLAPHSWSDEIPKGTQRSILKQAGLL